MTLELLGSNIQTVGYHYGTMKQQLFVSSGSVILSMDINQLSNGSVQLIQSLSV
jgi:hypothetical protein